MQYFVTGATGFIGKRLVKTLLARRGAVVHFLLRRESEGKVAGAARVLGRRTARASARDSRLRRPDREEARRRGRRHQASSRARSTTSTTSPRSTTCRADDEAQVAVNIEGTRNAVEFAKAIDAGHLHHVSSIAAAGLYEGVFREDMFDEAEDLDHPYFMTKHESEKIVRTEVARCRGRSTARRWSSATRTTGEMDKIDGPYYFFKLIQRMRQILPPWMPSIGLEGGRINIVPVDFVVAALDHISHLKTGARRALLPPRRPASATASATCSTSSARPRTRRR